MICANCGQPIMVNQGYMLINGKAIHMACVRRVSPKHLEGMERK